MIYINNNDVKQIKIDWLKLINELNSGIKLISKGDYNQPLKVYLRYGSPKNRIIAMPSYIGYGRGIAGLKWIASYPDNLKIGLQRANSVTVLNNAKSGMPEAIINSSKISSIRTAAVSGLVIKKYLNDVKKTKITVGIIGFGPIGYEHYLMCEGIINKNINFLIYDKNPKLVKKYIFKNNVKLTLEIKELFKKSDIVITATNVLKPFISLKPKKGTLILNVSLRDFVPEYLKYIRDGIIVDDWYEVNREGTNIENFVKYGGLIKDEVVEIKDLYKSNNKFYEDRNYMFCPMGMAVFDLIIACQCVRDCFELGLGKNLD